MKPKLSNKDFCRSSKKLRCEVAAIKTVAEVESLGNGFYGDGFPVILFERHIFRKYTQGRYNKSHPHLSGAPGNYGKAGQNQRNKFSEAFALNPEAAMKACSWGKFQIMGFNHAICGYATVDEFVDAMKESEGKQLDAFVSFVIANNLAIHLRNLNWASFAKGYNGAGYAKNRYDKKMAAAYIRYARENINCNQLSDEGGITSATDRSHDIPPTSIETDLPQVPSSSDVIENPVEVTQTNEEKTSTGKETIEVTSKNEQDVNIPAQVSSTNYQGVGFIGAIKKDFAVVGGGNLSFQTLQEYATSASGWPPWVISIITKVATVVIIAGGLWLGYRLIHYLIWKIGDWQRMKVEAHINSDPKRKNIEWT